MTEQDRRSNLRVPFIAYADITEDGSSVSIPVRVSDISNEGCYVDRRAPLPKEALVRVKVVTATDAFETEATVAYSDPHLGDGPRVSECQPAGPEGVAKVALGSGARAADLMSDVELGPR
jgi:hypothetical protein